VLDRRDHVLMVRRGSFVGESGGADVSLGKSSSGVGLALAREIAEAHRGRSFSHPPAASA
jgi:hypothetical protein